MKAGHAIAAFMLCGLVAHAADVPVADFLRSYDIGTLRLNRSGTELAAIYTGGGGPLMLYDVATSKPTMYSAVRIPLPPGFIDAMELRDAEWPAARFSGFSITNLRWVADRMLEIQFSLVHGATFIGYDEVRTDSHGQNSLSERTMLFKRLHPAGRTYPDLDQPLAYQDPPPHPPGNVLQTLYGADGMAAAVVTRANGSNHLYRRVGNEWMPCRLDLGSGRLLGLGDDPATILVGLPPSRGKPGKVGVFRMSDGAYVSDLASVPDYDPFGEVARSGDGRRTLGLVVPALYPKRIWWDPHFAAAQAFLDHQVRGRIPLILQGSDDGNEFLVELDSDREPPMYFLLNFDRKMLSLVKAAAPWIDPRRMRPVKSIGYNSRDGLTLEANVVIPTVFSRQHPAALIVLLHGIGGRYQWGWDQLAQLFAQWGYAVLVPNTREAVGLTFQTAPARLWDYGTANRDLEDGIDQIVTTGLVDPHRIALVGEKEGAASAMTLALNRPQAYRAIISFGGEFDFASSVTKAIQDGKMDQTGLNFHGDPRSNPAAYAPISPIQRIAELKTPLCLVEFHAFDYGDVNSQTDEMIGALKAHGIPYVYLHGARDNYDMTAAYADDQRVYDQLKAYLAEHL